MESNYIYYNFNRSLERIDEFLDGSDNNYEEITYVPSRSRLTYSNRFYLNVSAIFVDIRSSSTLTEDYYRPTLAKLYRSFISEVTAIMNGDIYCQEINIVGDCISGIFETDDKDSKNSLIETALKINGIIRVFNCKLSKNGIKPIQVGIGIDYGRALMIKVGYSGSQISEIVWMGDVVNNASKLCDEAKYSFNKTILISEKLYDTLPAEKRYIFDKEDNKEYYECDEINSEMEKWIEENCE